MTGGTSMLWNPETYIQQLLESVGLTWDGRATLREIKLSQNVHTIDITLTASCARNSVTVQTMEANPPPLQCKPTSPSQSSSDFSQNTSGRSLPIYDGMYGPMIPYEELVSWLRLRGVSVA